MPRRKHLPKPNRRRALELLASCRDGCTEAIMIAHGFTIPQMVELVRAGLATATARFPSHCRLCSAPPDDFSTNPGMIFNQKFALSCFPVSHLHFTEQDGGGLVGGGASSVDGIISTLKGNAGSWTAMIGKSLIGEWELALPNTREVKNLFKNEDIEDILFVITYSGRTPEWPA
jgi:hypothetical protein